MCDRANCIRKQKFQYDFSHDNGVCAFFLDLTQANSTKPTIENTCSEMKNDGISHRFYHIGAY
jgi:hypothetical protein